jgi:phage baseplate assembly protein W
MMEKDFLGKGFKFPVQVDGSGGVALNSYEENIESSLKIIIGTRPGERVMRPDFGCRIHELLFQPNNDATATQAAFYVREAIHKWEPRVENVRVSAYPDPQRDNVLVINVSYKVIRTNNQRNMVYPFYLRREENE